MHSFHGRPASFACCNGILLNIHGTMLEDPGSKTCKSGLLRNGFMYNRSSRNWDLLSHRLSLSQNRGTAAMKILRRVLYGASQLRPSWLAISVLLLVFSPVGIGIFLLLLASQILLFRSLLYGFLAAGLPLLLAYKKPKNRHDPTSIKAYLRWDPLFVAAVWFFCFLVVFAGSQLLFVLAPDQALVISEVISWVILTAYIIVFMAFFLKEVLP